MTRAVLFMVGAITIATPAVAQVPDRDGWSESNTTGGSWGQTRDGESWRSQSDGHGTSHYSDSTGRSCWTQQTPTGSFTSCR